MIDTIINANCLDVLDSIPKGLVHLVLTDPPWGIEEARGTLGKQRTHKISYEGGFTDNKDYIKNVCVPAIEKCLKIAERVIVTPGDRYFYLYPPPDSFGVIYQPASVGLQKWGFADAQPILYYGTDPRVGKTIKPCSRMVTERPPNGVNHPCPKPIRVWKWLADKGSLPGEVILDPFLGSGTTAVVAKQLGRHYIGIEISKRYCEIARQRLAQEELFSVATG